MTKAISLQTSKPSPTLNTVIMVEDVIKNAKDSVISIAEIKRALPKQVNHNTLMVILEYLEMSGKIFVTLKGITWLQNDNANIKRAIAKGREI